jgi:hypothetical protein
MGEPPVDPAVQLKVIALASVFAESVVRAVTAPGVPGTVAPSPVGEGSESPTAFRAMTWATTGFVATRLNGAAMRTLYGILHVVAVLAV